MNAEELRAAVSEDAPLLHSFVHPDIDFADCDGARCVRRRELLARSNQLQVIDRDRLARAARAFIDHLDSAPKLGWPDNDPAMLTWAAEEYRLQEGIRQALDSTTGDERG